MARELAKRWITADEYERMGEAGIFPQDARLELIGGEIFEMSPIESPHAARVKFLIGLFSRLLGGTFIVSAQDPVRPDDFSEPQPDVALLRWRDDFYRGAHPTAADVLLVVEVADTTVITDRRIKTPLYARAGIPEMWLVNTPGGQVEVYSEPSGDSYLRPEVFARAAGALSHTAEGLSVSVVELPGYFPAHAAARFCGTHVGINPC
jgi:Uma2 family endonuclease